MMEAPDQADVDSDSNTSEVLRFSFHAQLIGSVTQVTGPAQTVVESYLYDPYGKPTIKDAGGSTISASAIGNAYLFTGRQLDEETGLYYYRARHYSPELRRFIQRDPLEYVDGPSALAYTKNGPVYATDPSGEGWLAGVVAIVAGAVVAVAVIASAPVVAVAAAAVLVVCVVVEIVEWGDAEVAADLAGSALDRELGKNTVYPDFERVRGLYQESVEKKTEAGVESADVIDTFGGMAK